MSDGSSGSNQWPRPYVVDKQLYEDVWNWLAAKLPGRRSRGADIAAGDMYDFLAWICETNRRPVADRIARPSLDTDVQAYADDYIARDVPAIGGFRNRLLNLRDILRDRHFENWARERHVMFQGFDGAGTSSGSRSSGDTADSSGSSDSGNSGDSGNRTGSNQVSGPHDVDWPLHKDFWNWLTEKLPNHRSGGADHAAGDMYDFLEWIRETNRPPMVDRIALPSLDTDVQAYADAYFGRDAPAIGGFRNRLMNLRDMLRDFHRQVKSENWARARGAMFQGIEDAGPSSSPLAPTMPLDRPTIAAGAGAGQAERDFGAYVLPNWGGGLAPDPLIAALRESGLLPTLLRPQSVLINAMRYAAVLWPGRAPVTPNNPEGENIILTPGYRELGQLPHPRVEHMNEVGPPDIGERLGVGWIHGPQVANDFLISVLGEFRLLPTQAVPMTRFYIHREPYTAESGPGGRVLVIHRPQVR
ncbi:hypothetical protein [Bradyrhizobium genosp. P]|uniref:hypothetical protein n=1 Tax=Bradyrhizobium genosp. P TaxID=83641 RepID=UPI003CFA97BF